MTIEPTHRAAPLCLERVHEIIGNTGKSGQHRGFFHFMHQTVVFPQVDADVDQQQDDRKGYKQQQTGTNRKIDHGATCGLDQETSRTFMLGTDMKRYFNPQTSLKYLVNANILHIWRKLATSVRTGAGTTRPLIRGKTS